MRLSQQINKSPFWRSGVIAIPAILFACFLLVKSSYNARKFKETILKNYKFSTGKILEYNLAAKQTGNVIYRSEVNDSYIDGVYGSGQFMKLDSRMYSRLFPVIYSVEDPEKYNEILIFPDQYEKYQLVFPDSLFWVKKLLE